MYLIRILFVIMLLSTIWVNGNAQASFNTVGHVQRKSPSTSPGGFLGEQDGKFFFYEEVLFKRWRRLSIKVLDKKNLFRIQKQTYKNLYLEKTDKGLHVLRVWKNDDGIKLLVIDQENQEVAIHTISTEDLQITETRHTLFTSEREATVYTQLSVSANMKYTGILVAIEERDRPLRIISSSSTTATKCSTSAT